MKLFLVCLVLCALARSSVYSIKQGKDASFKKKKGVNLSEDDGSNYDELSTKEVDENIRVGIQKIVNKANVGNNLDSNDLRTEEVDKNFPAIQLLKKLAKENTIKNKLEYNDLSTKEVNEKFPVSQLLNKLAKEAIFENNLDSDELSTKEEDKNFLVSKLIKKLSNKSDAVGKTNYDELSTKEVDENIRVGIQKIANKATVGNNLDSDDLSTEEVSKLPKEATVKNNLEKDVDLETLDLIPLLTTAGLVPRIGSKDNTKEDESIATSEETNAQKLIGAVSSEQNVNEIDQEEYLQNKAGKSNEEYAAYFDYTEDTVIPTTKEWLGKGSSEQVKESGSLYSQENGSRLELQGKQIYGDYSLNRESIEGNGGEIESIEGNGGEIEEFQENVTVDSIGNIGDNRDNDYSLDSGINPNVWDDYASQSKYVDFLVKVPEDRVNDAKRTFDKLADRYQASVQKLKVEETVVLDDNETITVLNDDTNENYDEENASPLNIILLRNDTTEDTSTDITYEITTDEKDEGKEDIILESNNLAYNTLDTIPIDALNNISEAAALEKINDKPEALNLDYTNDGDKSKVDLTLVNEEQEVNMTEVMESKETDMMSTDSTSLHSIVMKMKDDLMNMVKNKFDQLSKIITGNPM